MNPDVSLLMKAVGTTHGLPYRHSSGTLNPCEARTEDWEILRFGSPKVAKIRLVSAFLNRSVASQSVTATMAGFWIQATAEKRYQVGGRSEPAGTGHTCACHTFWYLFGNAASWILRRAAFIDAATIEAFRDRVFCDQWPRFATRGECFNCS